MVNTCIIGGTVSRPPRQFSGEKSKGIGFNLAVKNEATGKNVLFMDVVAWGEGADNSELAQGDFVIAQGQVRARSYTDKNGSTVWVKELSCPLSAITVVKGNGEVSQEGGGGEGEFPF